VLTRYGAGIDSKVRLIGAAPTVGLRDSAFRPGQKSLPNAGGFNRSSSVPIGYRDAEAYVLAEKNGGMAGRDVGRATVSAAIEALGRLQATLVAEAVATALANAGIQIQGTAGGSALSSALLAASGTLRSNLLIGASPSSIDIADAVWSRNMSPFTEVGTFGYQLANLTGGGGGGGGGPTASQIADAVWAWATRTLTASPGPSAAAIASQVRTELAVELGRIDAAITSRLAAAGYTAPDNVGIAAIQAKTDTLPAQPASETTVAARPTLAQIEASTVLAKEATVSTRATQTTADAIKQNTDLIPAAL